MRIITKKFSFVCKTIEKVTTKNITLFGKNLKRLFAVNHIILQTTRSIVNFHPGFVVAIE